MKSNLAELAIFGGEPLFLAPLHVGRPNLGNRDQLLARINDLLDRRWFSNNGPFVQELESKIAQLLGVKHCIATVNGTVGLEILIRALGLTGEVIVPSFTFIATAHALQWQGITPIFADIDPTTHNLDPHAVERLITPRTTGIIGVHLWGRGCATQALTELAQRHKLNLLFDASHAFNCSHQGTMMGNFGAAEVFSFHATKFFNTFEGGAIVTNRDDLAAKIRLMKNFGFSGYDNVVYEGTNGKMSEVCAAMGLTSLESLGEFVKVNYQNYLHYQQQLSNIPGIKIINYDPQESNNYQYIILEIDKTATGISRDHLVQLLHTENILARRYFYPGCHRMEPYRSMLPHARLWLPMTERLTSKVMCLPTGTTVGASDIDAICQLIRLIVTQGELIGQHFKLEILDIPTVA